MNNKDRQPSRHGKPREAALDERQQLPDGKNGWHEARPHRQQGSVNRKRRSSSTQDNAEASNDTVDLMDDSIEQVRQLQTDSNGGSANRKKRRRENGGRPTRSNDDSKFETDKPLWRANDPMQQQKKTEPSLSHRDRGGAQQHIVRHSKHTVGTLEAAAAAGVGPRKSTRENHKTGRDKLNNSRKPSLYDDDEDDEQPLHQARQLPVQRRRPTASPPSTATKKKLRLSRKIAAQQNVQDLTAEDDDEQDGMKSPSVPRKTTTKNPPVSQSQQGHALLKSAPPPAAAAAAATSIRHQQRRAGGTTMQPPSHHSGGAYHHGSDPLLPFTSKNMPRLKKDGPAAGGTAAAQHEKNGATVFPTSAASTSSSVGAVRATPKALAPELQNLCDGSDSDTASSTSRKVDGDRRLLIIATNAKSVNDAGIQSDTRATLAAVEAMEQDPYDHFNHRRPNLTKERRNETIELDDDDRKPAAAPSHELRDDPIDDFGSQHTKAPSSVLSYLWSFASGSSDKSHTATSAAQAKEPANTSGKTVFSLCGLKNYSRRKKPSNPIIPGEASKFGQNNDWNKSNSLFFSPETRTAPRSIDDTDDEWTSSKAWEGAAPMESRRSSGRLAKKQKTVAPSSPVDLVDDSSDEDSGTTSLQIDLARIAFGSKKIVRDSCKLQLSVQDTEIATLTLSYLSSSGRVTRNSDTSFEVVRHPIVLGDGLNAARVYRSSTEFGDGLGDDQDDEIIPPFLALDVNRSKENGLLTYSRSMSGDELAKKCVLVEFRTNTDLETVLNEAKGCFLGQLLDSGTELDDAGARSISKFLRKDASEERQHALTPSSPSKKAPFLLGKSTDKVLVVYPFAEDRDKIDAAADGLQECSGRIAMDEDYHPERRTAPPGKHKGRSHFLSIQVQDYERLEPREWLNDTIVDFWMRWICRHNDMSEIHVFSSHFYSALLKDGASGVVHWTENKDIDVFSKRFIFLPINKALHWSLAVIVNPGAIANHLNVLQRVKSDAEWDPDSPVPCILFFDSLKCHDKRAIARNLRLWLNCEWKRLRKDVTFKDAFGKDVTFENPFAEESLKLLTPKVPYQNNGYDCGVYAGRYALGLLRQSGEAFTYREGEFASEDGSYVAEPSLPFRCIITKAPAFKFQVRDMNRIRSEMTTLLERLHVIYVPWRQKEDEKEAEEARKEKEAQRAKKIAEAQKKQRKDAEPSAANASTAPEKEPDATEAAKPSGCSGLTATCQTITSQSSAATQGSDEVVVAGSVTGPTTAASEKNGGDATPKTKSKVSRSASLKLPDGSSAEMPKNDGEKHKHEAVSEQNDDYITPKSTRQCVESVSLNPSDVSSVDLPKGDCEQHKRGAGTKGAIGSQVEDLDFSDKKALSGFIPTFRDTAAERSTSSGTCGSATSQDVPGEVFMDVDDALQSQPDVPGADENVPDRGNSTLAAERTVPIKAVDDGKDDIDGLIGSAAKMNLKHAPAVGGLPAQSSCEGVKVHPGASLPIDV